MSEGGGNQILVVLPAARGDVQLALLKTARVLPLRKLHAFSLRNPTAVPTRHGIPSLRVYVYTHTSNDSCFSACIEKTVRVGPAHRHGGVLRWPTALEGEVFYGRGIIEMPLEQRHVGRGRQQGVRVPAVRHRKR